MYLKAGRTPAAAGRRLVSGTRPTVAHGGREAVPQLLVAERHRGLGLQAGDAPSPLPQAGVTAGTVGHFLGSVRDYFGRAPLPKRPTACARSCSVPTGRPSARSCSCPAGHGTGSGEEQVSVAPTAN